MASLCPKRLGGKILCVGRNYREHAAEFNNPVPSKPMLFAKTANALLAEGDGCIRTPPGCKNLHYEVELGVIMGKRASNIGRAEAMQYVGAYTVALDMTARDFQDDLKKQGHPWYLAKSFDTSCPFAGSIIEASKVGGEEELSQLEIYCLQNGQQRQRAMVSGMIFSIPELLEYASKFFTLEKGDMLLTGTPAGVGQCKKGDELEIGISGLISAKFKVE